MSGWGGGAPLVLLAVSAIGVAGCGSSSTTTATSIKQDVQQVTKATLPLLPAFHQAETSGTHLDAASIETLSRTTKQAADTLKGISAPAALQSKQQALEASLIRLSDATAVAVTDLKGKNSPTLAHALDIQAAIRGYHVASIAWFNAAKTALGQG
ncbi:MAG TPA: hypothetical protein VGF81_00555 [Solirubrobacteraceae bacterium]|jgi:hypothetical protein